MARSILSILVVLQLSLGVILVPPSLAQEWAVRVKPRGTLKVVDFRYPAGSIMVNYAEPLVDTDKDNNLIPSLASDWRWLDDRTVEFKLRKDVTFHNGEKFDAEAVRVNWEEYKKMECPHALRSAVLPDETKFELVDEYTVRFILPEPDGIAMARYFRWLLQFAPSFFKRHRFGEMNWGYLADAGPWGTGPFELVEGSLSYGRYSDRVVLEAYEDYWDPRYPKVKTVIFDNTLIGDRDEAMRLCREQEGAVDIVNFIRPLDTLKVAESRFARVVKSRDIGLLFGWFNECNNGSKWKDIRLRKAVNYAVNREELWKYAARANAYNLGGFFIPPGGYGHNPNLTLYTYDTTKARALLAEAGYPDGFELKLITHEAWKLEAQIISKMLERVGLRVTFDVLPFPEWLSKVYHPLLDKLPEEEDWDISIEYVMDWSGNTAASFLWWLLRDSDYRWNELDPVYEEMWDDMVRTVDPEAQEAKIREMVRYSYDQAHYLYIYTPLTLYAVNKEVDFIPQKCWLVRLKETSVTDNHWSVREEAE